MSNWKRFEKINWQMPYRRDRKVVQMRLKNVVFSSFVVVLSVNSKLIQERLPVRIENRISPTTWSNF